MKKTYFLPPDFDIPPPPEGPIALGHILLDRSDTAPLNPNSLQPIDTVYRSWKSEFKATRKQLQDGKYGIWAQFLEMSGFGGELSWKHEKSANDVYTFEKIDTEFFQPDKQYIEKSMKADEVEIFMKEEGYKTPVYMITGMKIARGATLESAEKHSVDVKASFGIDGAALGAPGVAFGPTIEHGRSREEETSFEDSSDFVLAYRLRKIWYKRDKITIENKLFDDGAMFGTDEDKKKTAEHEVEEVDAVAEDFKTSDALDGKGMRAVEQKDDDGEDCVWVVPTHGD